MTEIQPEVYELYWNNHTQILKGTFDIFRNDNELVDVTLSCEGKKLRAHKIVLSACSEYFLDLFRDNPCQHPIIIMRDINYDTMVNILNFMYTGEINIAVEQLNTFLKIAEILQVKGLAVEVPQGKVLNEHLNEKRNVKRSLKDTNEQNTLHPKVSKTNRLTHKYIDDENITEENNCTSRNLYRENNKLKKDCVTNVDESLKCVDDLTGIIYKEGEKEVKVERIDMNILNVEGELEEQELSLQYDGECNPPLSLGKSYPCPHCKKVFQHYISLKLHLPRHSGDTRCGLCHAVLGRKYDLKVHMRRKHNIDLQASRGQPLPLILT